MSARSSIAISVVLLGTVACGGTAPTSGPPTAAGPTSAAASTKAPTAAPTVSPAPTRLVGVFPNADGSTFVGLPTRFGHAQPGAGRIWGVLQYGEDTRDIVRIDPETFDIQVLVDDLPVLANPVHGVAFSGSFWLSSWDKSSVEQYDLATGELIREIKVGLHPIEPVVAYGDVWTLDHHGDSVTRIDVDTGEAQSIQMPGSLPLQVTPVSDDLMLVNGVSPTTYVIDPDQMEFVDTYQPSGCYEAPGWHASAIDGRLWRKRCDVDEVAILDARTGEVLETFPSPIHASIEPLVVDGIWWFPTAAEYDAGLFTLAGFDPETREIVGTWQHTASITEGWAFAGLNAWWRWGNEGILGVPADTLRAAVE